MNCNSIVYGVFIFSMYVAWVRCSARQKSVHIISMFYLAGSYIAMNFAPDVSGKFIFYFRCASVAVGLALLAVAALSKIVQLPGVKVSRKQDFFTTWFSNPVQAIFGFFFYMFVKALPIKFASKIGEGAGRFCAKLNMPVNKKALENIRKCFPEKTEEECRKIFSDSWSVFLRFVFEVPVMQRIYKHSDKYISVEGEKYLDDLHEKPVVVVFAHYGNVSLVPFLFTKNEIKGNGIFRYPNNRLMSWFFLKMASVSGSISPIPKGDAGTRLAMKALIRKEALMIAVDQRFESAGSLDLKFFGRRAATAPGAVKLAKAFDAQIVPVHVVQLPQSKYKIVVDKPFSAEGDDTTVGQKINDIVEEWVRKNPKQWFWLHKRWGRN